MSPAKVTVTVPFNVTYATPDHIYKEGETFEIERADVEALLRHGNLVELKKKR
jgi:CBS-domain-containing membrane protein